MNVPCRLAIYAALAAITSSGFAAETGEQIYQRLCASCHGAKGEGNDDEYPHPLIGDRSLQELTQYVDKSMPEGEPEKCDGEDAVAVSKYVYDTFYSAVAQARNKPVRIELSRLTVRQYRNAVADLLADLTPSSWGEDRGLHGEYYKSGRFRDRVIDRTDPQLQFAFGEGTPEEGKFESDEFSIRWEGSVIAPENGEYEFNLKTENGARLWVNDNDTPLVDVWVRSGKELDHKQSIYLLGGRAYPLKVEFFKSKKAKEKSASIALEWKLPSRQPELIPQRYLIPKQVPSVYVVQTPFPPDDRSIGYERGTSISKEWDQATTDSALALASYVAEHLEKLTDSRGSVDRERSREFCQKFVERAFRRPLTEEQQQFFVGRHFADGTATDEAVKRVVLLVMKSPRFLYRELSDKQDSYDIASRLSFGLWDSLPDRTLLELAAAGKLSTREEVAAQATRMLEDPRARFKLREFFFQWLKVDQAPDIAKDPSQYPDFSSQTASDLRTSLDLFLEDILWNGSGDFRQLLLSESLYLNGRLSKLYGSELPAEAPFQKVTFDPQERAGILSHPYLMAGFSYTASSSPIHRGVFLARSVLGRSLRVPPEAVAPLIADLHPDLTTRERVALQTKPEACQTCHAMLNPLGFSLENFDAIGRFRREEKGRAVDASGQYQTRNGEVVQFQGVRDLANFLANCDETHAAFVEQLFHYFVKQPIRAYGSNQITQLRGSFRDHSFNVRQLLVDIMVSSAMHSPR